MKVQEGNEQNAETKHYTPDKYRQHNKSIMRWWTFLGPTTNRSLLMIAGLLSRPDWFCWLVVVPVNLYLLWMLVWQKKVTQQLDNGTNPTTLHAASKAA